ncbi:hypothetical protein P170DRAFT_433347 [Aspergillus steynii IBT 23096]|uniref:DUF7136 domain-containing protein n=1 Tax=Aspergillus steynii IBT 23096 TaxID=1392250 RepID=A0A2I2GSL8_9EURO|nr:uncharacterized protein P170DRAFT_433347 [Aspergillus steynii IBT 23096]PLB55871.1 hypothetical protein P170DRAFT_433347 [Aspergillus steynii IBT 23096]
MKPSKPTSSTRRSSAFWTTISPLVLLSNAIIQPAKAISYPTTIEIDLLFPLPNKTYPNITSFPVIFALQNVPAANEFGYTISWNLRSEENSTVALGSIYKMTYRNNTDLPFLLDDGNIAILPDTAYNGTRLESGRYSLAWKYSMVTCTQIGDRTQYNIGKTQAGNTHFFDVEEKGRAETSGFKLGLDAECPVFADSIVVRDATKGGCPFMKGSSDADEKDRDPCRAKLNAKQANCVQGNVTGNYNASLCREAFGDGDASESGAGRMVANGLGMFGIGVVGFIGVLGLL